MITSITKPFDGTELLNAVDSRLKKLDLLKQELIPDLEGLPYLMHASFGKDILQSFTEDCNINKYKRKETVYSQGNHPNRLYYVTKGKVKIFKRNDDGKELGSSRGTFFYNQLIDIVACILGSIKTYKIRMA
jgi:CRP/FNR family transcriptional regulator, cyclic AMP receptor protein